MLTIFALPKPFKGHVGLIQRNAIAQWARLSPKPEILLFGNEEGTAAVAREFGLRHLSDVKRNEYGTPLLSDLFEQAQSLASWSSLCYVNADILLLGNFLGAVQRVSSWQKRFLIVGVRRNVELDSPALYESGEQEYRLRALVLRQNRAVSRWAIDYFVFPRRLLPSFPAFAVGRPHWDNWFLWKACQSKAVLVDASEIVLAVHQNHDYSHHPQGKFGVFHGDEERQNRNLAGRHVYTIEDATHRLMPVGIAYNWRRLLAPRHRVWRAIQSFYFSALRVTGPLRHPLGLRQENVVNALGKIRLFRGR